MAPKVHCFAGICHHRLVTTNAHTHEPSFYVEKIYIHTYVVLLHEHKGKVDFFKTIIDILQAMTS